jgi:hypothetical protein
MTHEELKTAIDAHRDAKLNPWESADMVIEGLRHIVRPWDSRPHLVEIIDAAIVHLENYAAAKDAIAETTVTPADIPLDISTVEAAGDPVIETAGDTVPVKAKGK